MPITMKDIASELNITEQAVSMALRSYPNISPERIKQVQETAKKMGYRPNRLARSLATGKTFAIGVLEGQLGNTLKADFVKGINAVCEHQKYHTLLMTEHGNTFMDTLMNMLMEHQVDGIVADIYECDPEAVFKTVCDGMKSGVPFCIFGNRSLAGRVDCAYSDEAQGSMEAVGHLISLGHRRIAHLSSGEGGVWSRDRKAGYVAALNSAGIGVDPSLIVGKSWDWEEAAANMGQLLNISDPPTAVFAASDHMAAMAIRVIRDRGLRVPEDIAVVGCEDEKVAYLMDITSVSLNPVDVGRRAAELLLARIKDPSLPAQAVKLPTSLKIRKSSGGPRGQERR